MKTIYQFCKEMIINEFGGNKGKSPKFEIKDITPKNIPVLVARPGMISYRLYLQPIDYAVKYDGSDRPEIRSISELMDYCRGCDRGRWM